MDANRKCGLMHIKEVPLRFLLHDYRGQMNPQQQQQHYLNSRYLQKIKCVICNHENRTQMQKQAGREQIVSFK